MISDKKNPEIDNAYFEKIKKLKPEGIKVVSFTLFDMESLEDLEKYL